MKTVTVSGGFDPIHKGHVRLFKEAKKLGDKLIVILNNDNWLLNKKGFIFQPEEERKEILESIRFVDQVVITKHKRDDQDTSVCSALKEVCPDIFANGGDRFPDNIPEAIVCRNADIELAFNVGGEKIQSSSELVKNVNNNK